METYTTDEIHILWEYATPLKRLLLLLRLNCGFDAKMRNFRGRGLTGLIMGNLSNG